MSEKEINTSDMRMNFHKIYYEKIAPMMEKYEKERKFIIFKIFLLEILIIGLFLLVLHFTYASIQSTSTNGVLIILDILLFVSCFIIPFPFNDKFSKKLKKSCMPKILKAFGDISWYNSKKESTTYIPIDECKYIASDLFSSFNHLTSDDSFTGSYKGVKFSINEVHMWYETGSGKNRSYRNVFKGVTINFDANKTIKSKTIIATKWDSNIKNRWFTTGTFLFTLALVISGFYLRDYEIMSYSLISFIAMVAAILYEKCSKNKNILKEIKLEDPKFNSKYRAYSSDEVEGRYLITTAFMERFNNIRTAFGSRGAKCSFYGNSLMFAISTNKNLFEVGNLFTPLNNPKQLKRFMNELISIFALVDYFKLDEKIGL